MKVWRPQQHCEICVSERKLHALVRERHLGRDHIINREEIHFTLMIQPQ